MKMGKHFVWMFRFRSGRLAMATVLLLGVILSTSTSFAAASTSSTAMDAVNQGSQTWTIESGGAERSFRIYVPENLVLDQPVPLVVMLHGGFGSARQAEESYGWDTMADIGGFVVVFPNGDGRAWNGGGGCCGEPGRTDRDDVGFITDMLDLIDTRLPIDQNRVFATGMSNGAIMTYRLACETDRFAAIAPVAGTQLVDCASPTPTSILAIHGIDDESVRFDGSRGSGFAKIDGPPVEDVIAFWRGVNECGAPVEVTIGDVTDSYAACVEGRAVELLAIANMGHTWPGGGRGPGAQLRTVSRGGDDIIATISIWEFFSSHPRA